MASHTNFNTLSRWNREGEKIPWSQINLDLMISFDNTLCVWLLLMLESDTMTVYLFIAKLSLIFISHLQDSLRCCSFLNVSPARHVNNTREISNKFGNSRLNEWRKCAEKISNSEETAFLPFWRTFESSRWKVVYVIDKKKTSRRGNFHDSFHFMKEWGAGDKRLKLFHVFHSQEKTYARQFHGSSTFSSQTFHWK